MPKVEDLVGSVRKWGGITTDAILDPQTKIFSLPEIEGCIGYRLLDKSAVVLGDPIAPKENISTLTNAFHQYCQEKGFHLCYLLASDPFKNWAMSNGCAVSIEVGEIVSIDPESNPFNNTGEKGSLVRRKVRRAEKSHVTIKEYMGDNPSIEEAILDVSTIWLSGKHKLRTHLSEPEIFAHREGKRWVYAECEGKIIGFLILNRLHAYQGWLLNHIMVLPDAPGGTPEALVIKTLEALHTEGCHYVTFGPIARAEIGKIEGLSKISTSIVELLSKMFKKMVRHGGLNTFWGKFQPNSAPCHLIFYQKKVSIKNIQNLMKTLNFTL